jgi:hypothetical protein
VIYTSRDLKDNFAVTIQFTNYKDHRTDMLLTTNTDIPLDVTNMRIHGISLANNHSQLNNKDHEGLQAFCRSYLEECGFVVR